MQYPGSRRLPRLLFALLFSAGLPAAVGTSGCSGSMGGSSDEGGGGEGGDGDGDEGGNGSGGKGSGGGKGGNGSGSSSIENPLAAPKDGSLERNPAQELTCTNRTFVGPTGVSRLTNAEYANTLRDLVAPLSLANKPSLPLETITDGFSNNWKGQTPSDRLVEALEENGRAVGALVAGGLDKLGIKGCPPSGAAGEGACVDAFLDSFAKKAFRRPLADDEKTRWKGFYDKVRPSSTNFADAIAQLAEAIVESPQFLYKLEVGSGGGAEGVKLTGYEIATRLSYLLWDTMPDADLWKAAEDGSLAKVAGIEAQVARMLKDGKARAAIDEFARQWVSLDRLAGNASATKKRPDLFKDYTEPTATALLDGLTTYMQDALVGDGGGLNKLLTGKSAFVNAASAKIWGLSANGNDLARVDANAAQRKGLLTQAGLLAGLAHDAAQSPVLRGVFVLEHLLCQPPPPPPMGMIPPQPAPDPNVKRTVRQRLVVEHEEQAPGCKACHQLIDGVGFAFENYDALGRWQTMEGDLPVDPSAVIKGTGDADGEFPNALAMIDKLAGSQQVAQCFTEQWFRYALARSLEDGDGCALASITDEVVASKGDFGALVRAITKAPAFRYRAPLAR